MDSKRAPIKTNLVSETATGQYVILHVFPSFEIGGSQMRFAQLAHELGPTFHNKIISLSGNWDALKLVESLDNCDATPTPSMDAGIVERISLIREQLKENPPDLLVTYNWGSIEYGLANLFFNLCPHIDIEDGFGPTEGKRRLFRRNLMRRIVYRRSAAVVVPSKTLSNIAQCEWGVKPCQIHFIPNGINSSRFSSSQFNKDVKLATLKKYGIENTQIPVIGTIATLRKEKNIQRLIRAFNICRKTQKANLVIVGSGPELELLKQKAALSPYASSIIFTGHIARPEDIIGGFDLLALASDTEQMPLSVLESMAAGKTIVAVDVGDIKAMVSQSNQKYICHKNTAALAEGLNMALSDKAELKAIGEDNIRKVTSDYELKDMIHSYGQLFLNAINNKQS